MSFPTSTSSIPPSQTSGSSGNVPTSLSLPSSRTTQPPSTSSSIGQPSLTTTPPFTSSSSIQAVTLSSTAAVPSGISTGGSHPTHRNVIIAVATSLGLVVLAAVATLISLYLRRLYRRRQLRQSTRRAHPSDICVTAAEIGNPKTPDALQRDLSNLLDARVSTEPHPSAPLSSVIDISGPRTSVFVAPPTSPIARREVFLQSSPSITPRPSGEDRDVRKTPTEPVSQPGGPADIDRGPPIAPAPADPVSVLPRRSGTPRGSRRFVTVLIEVPDEEEHELPPPYQPGQRVMSAWNADVLQHNRSPSPNTQVSTANPSSLPSYSMIDVATPIASASVASPSSPLGPLEGRQRRASLPIAPQPLSEDLGCVKADGAIQRVAVPGSEQDHPASPPADPSAASIRSSAVLRWTRSVMTLSDIADEEEREMPPPYQPPPRATYNQAPDAESRVYGDA
ncbi:hypothetical protein VTO73DRAFT_8994 [Trametes versicolor]